MLVLSRKRGEKLLIGNGTTVTLVEVKGNRVRVGIEAPDQVRILRAEVAGWEVESADSTEPADAAFVCRKSR
jgi:carbon storage regulator